MKRGNFILSNIILLMLLLSSCGTSQNKNSANSKITDIDGNIYKTVTIGTQVWMAENLKTTKYNDGTAIPLVTDSKAWTNLTTPAYCWYNNDTINKEVGGAFYNWFTVDITSNGGKNVCPKGWHLPTDEQWTILTDYLTNNGYGYEGSGNDIAKSLATTSGWTSDGTAGNAGNDQMSNNSSGFTAVPDGYRYFSGPLFGNGSSGIWWSSTEYDAEYAWPRNIFTSSSTIGRDYGNKHYGFSVRCIKDNF